MGKVSDISNTLIEFDTRVRIIEKKDQFKHDIIQQLGEHDMADSTKEQILNTIEPTQQRVLQLQT